MSWKRRRDLSVAQLQEEPGQKVEKLISECPTRWGSTQHMISRVLHNKKAIRRVLGNDKDTSHLVPSWQDFEVLGCIDSALSPLKKFTDILSASTYVTISTLKPLLHRLSTVELAIQDEDPPLASQLKTQVLSRLKSKYVAEDLKVLMNVASFLDLRYKTDFLSTGELDNEEDKPSEFDVVKEELLGQAVFLVSHEEEIDASPSPEPATKKVKLSLGALTSLKKPKNTPSAAQSPRDRLSPEIERYVAYPVIDGDENPLKWWQQNEREFLLLSQLAKKYLAIQATSSPSERLLGKG